MAVALACCRAQARRAQTAIFGAPVLALRAGRVLQMARCSARVSALRRCGAPARGARARRVHRRAESTTEDRSSSGSAAEGGTSGLDGERAQKWAKPFSFAQFFGSYLQLGVWISVLSLAAFVGLRRVR